MLCEQRLVGGDHVLTSLQCLEYIGAGRLDASHDFADYIHGGIAEDVLRIGSQCH